MSAKYQIVIVLKHTIMKTTLIAVLIATTLLSCKDGDDEPTVPEVSNPPEVQGMNYAQSESSVDSVYTRLITALENNPNIGIIAQVDHQRNAESVEKDLRPTRVVFFGNPNLGTPLMQQNPLAGLDLPQKMLVYENELKEVFIGYNNTEYLAGRHGVDSVATLPMIANALQNLSGNASGGEVKSQEATVGKSEGIMTITSAQDFEATYTALRGAIENNSNLRLVAELDHQANAARVGEELSPLRLIIFGNPNLGTPLMQSSQTTALDLPQKMLVWEDSDGSVKISYNDPAYLVKRHGITGQDQIIETISGALATLSGVASGN